MAPKSNTEAQRNLFLLCLLLFLQLDFIGHELFKIFIYEKIFLDFIFSWHSLQYAN